MHVLELVDSVKLGVELNATSELCELCRMNVSVCKTEFGTVRDLVQEVEEAPLGDEDEFERTD